MLAVGTGASNRPRFVVVSSRPFDADADTDADADVRHVVLVGQGITFDTGGLQIKPRLSLPPMKTEMAGAAVALASVWAAARSNLPQRVTAVLPLAENAVAAGAYRPSDVITLMGGTSVEIGSTDAAGRVVVAEAMAYAAAHLAPDVLIDVATLSAATTVALGRTLAPFYTSDEVLAAALEGAAERSGEPVWRMPLVADYAGVTTSAVTTSGVAALRPVPDGDHGVGGGGSIVAATFLRRFTGGVPWVHLDIAGTARASKMAHEVAEGPTGYGVRLLLEMLPGL